MLSLGAVLRHPALRGMRCVAGRGGLARSVANVAFLDYEPTQGSYANFYRDELVLSTLLFAKGQPALAWQAMEGLMRRGVTAIAVKTVFVHEFPPQVCACLLYTSVPREIRRNCARMTPRLTTRTQRTGSTCRAAPAVTGEYLSLIHI